MYHERVPRRIHPPKSTPEHERVLTAYSRVVDAFVRTGTRRRDARYRLATTLGVSYTTVSRWLRGTHGNPADVVRALESLEVS